MKSKRFLAIVMLVLSVSLTFSSCKKEESLTAGEISTIVTDAYVYAYPLIVMKVTADKATNVVQPTNLGFAPYNQISHRNSLPGYDFTSVVSPNVDTFYSSAWLDLEAGPVVLAVPDATLYKPEGGSSRYYLVQLMDAWSNVFAAPGVRTTGTGAGIFLISGPGWSGTVPGGMIHYESPTNMVWLLGRTMVKDSTDVPSVMAFQHNMSLMPLSAWPGPYSAPHGVFDPAIDMLTAPATLVANLPLETYFQMLCDQMVKNPAASYDSEMVKNLEKLGIAPGANFNLSGFSETDQAAIMSGYASGQAEMGTLVNSITGYNQNGWKYLLQGMGAYGDNYKARAYVASIGLGANLPEDAVYPAAFVDKDQQPLINNNRYTITFPAGQTPPANGFWSITLYNKNQFLVYNPILRYSVGSYSGLVPNNDGSITIYIQKDSPGIDKESNWLPAPQDANSSFNLKMRIYWPSQAVLDNQWVIPGVVKVD